MRRDPLTGNFYEHKPADEYEPLEFETKAQAEAYDRYLDGDYLTKYYADEEAAAGPSVSCIGSTAPDGDEQGRRQERVNARLKELDYQPYKRE